MRDLNVVVVSGRLGADPELKQFDSGTYVCDFDIANSQDYFSKEKNDWVNDVHWFHVQMFGPTSEKVAKTYKKGDKVVVTGVLKVSTWEKEGKKNSRTFLRADKVMPMGATKTGEGGSAPVEQEYTAYEPMSDEDIF